MDCRLGEVAIESGQFLAAGQALFEAHGTASTELEVQIPADQLRNLIRPELQSMAVVTMDVEIDFAQSDCVCLQSGLYGGEMLVVSDPSPAIEGMLVEAEVDESVSLRLVAEATGEGRLR